MPPTNKDLLGLRGVPKEEIEEILLNAAQLKQVLMSSSKKTPHLQGKSIVTLFYENSTRTRMSFELASKYMSAAAANIAASGSSVQKGETLIDTGVTLDHMGTDVIIIRHPQSGAPHLLARHVRSSVINAGDGVNEHPTQALLDMLTMRERFGELKGLRVAIVGDIEHSRVARSNAFGLATMGANVVFAGPPTLMPVHPFPGVEVTYDVDAAVRDADVVMALRIQKERLGTPRIPSEREYASVFGLSGERLSQARDHALIMHPGPMNRGVEITSDLADSDDSRIDEQVTNGVAVRMALLFLYTRRGAKG
jgi:aspartate carbamoyltransferase catalytic subunit